MMAQATPESMKEILYSAMREDIGLLLQVSDFPRARQALYRARADAEDAGLAILQFRASPGIAGGNMIIVKERVQVQVSPTNPLAEI